MEGLVLELGLEGLALADVAHVQHDPRDRLVGEQVGGQHFDVAPAALGVAHEELGRTGWPAGCAATEATNACMREASSAWTSSMRDFSERLSG